jgi:hypothetical protein
MERPAKLLFRACLTTMLAAAEFNNLSAAESEASAQVLLEEDIPDQVTTAHLMRRPDTYVLRIVLDRPPTPASKERASAEKPAPAAVTGANDATSTPVNRDSFFIGNTIANLRGLDPTFGCRTLTLMDGRRVAGAQQAAPPPTTAMNQPYPPKLKDPRVDVWLLKADGTQILPATYSCDWARPVSPKSRPHAEITYEFPRADADQAVAAAIRIEDRYFIEKL